MEQLLNYGVNYSGCYGYSILFKSKNFYVMDNHGAALWTWLQHIDLRKKYNFIHIDKHYDTLDSNLQHWINSLPPNLKDLTIEEYYNLKYQRGQEEFPVIRWDNYIPIFNALYGNIISDYIFYTHGCGTTGIKSLDRVQEWPIMSMFENIENLINENEEKTILNLDIDFFFADHDGNYFQLFSDESIDILFNQIQNCFLCTNKIEVISVALSPECCGGWSNSIKIYNKLAMQLKIETIQITGNRIVLLKDNNS